MVEMATGIHSPAKWSSRRALPTPLESARTAWGCLKEHAADRMEELRNWDFSRQHRLEASRGRYPMAIFSENPVWSSNRTMFYHFTWTWTAWNRHFCSSDCLRKHTVQKGRCQTKKKKKDGYRVRNRLVFGLERGVKMSTKSEFSHREIGISLSNLVRETI